MLGTVRQYDPYAAQLGFLSENIHRHLTERECGIFDRGLADYHRRRNIKAFVECLSLVLNTNQKRQLLIPIRDTYVKPSDTVRFNQLVQAHGLATSLKKKRRELEGEKNKSSDGIHRADVKRDSNGEWGFNIRGGSDQGTGVFISWVEPESNAHRNGLQVGDQILKANETSFEHINHHDAVQLIRGCKKLRLWLLSHGRVPSTRMAHKVYRWVDADGRPTTPPPDPFDIAEQRTRGDYRLNSEADERKVTIMVDRGKELGISIRGGSEHGLGVYISKVEEASVAEAYGIKVGDQILEVNGISFLNIVHADAARALRAQPCMVIKVRDVGKLPHSRVTTYGQTKWHQSNNQRKPRVTQKDTPSKAFQKGAGTQVMLRKHDTGIQGRGMMNEVARSVLTSHELSTFTYYIDQYEHRSLTVDDLTTALLELLDTAEKLQLIGEVRGIIRASDLDRYNELTIHHEIAAKKARKKVSLGSFDGSHNQLVSRDGSGLMASSQSPRNPQQIIAEIHREDPRAHQPHLSPPAAADISFSSEDRAFTPEEGVDYGGRDQVPQRMSPVSKKPGAVFRAPPPPSSEPTTSTPDGGGQPQGALANGLKQRRQRMRPGLSDQSTVDEEDGVWDSHFSAEPSLSTIRSPQMEAVSAASLPEIEARIQQELEQKLKRDFEEKERRLQEEHQRKLEQEKQEKDEQLRLEREALEQQLAEAEERTAREVENRVRREAEQEMRRQIEEKERAITEEMERLAVEHQERLKQESQQVLAEREEEEKERMKMELEERIWKEAEESLRQEFESRMHHERENLQHQSDELKTLALEEAEHKIQEQLEKKYQQQYEEKLRAEKQRLREREQEEQHRKQVAERQRQEEEVERMEAEEQARIDLEEKIRKETESALRAEYEARLQFETEQRAHLADEVKAHRAAEQRLEQEREHLEREIEREKERKREQAEREQEHKREEEEQRQQQQRRERGQQDRGEPDQHAREQQPKEELGRREKQKVERRQGEESWKRGMNKKQRLAQERQQREREEEEQRRQIQQQQQYQQGENQSEEDDEAEKLLKIQRQQAEEQAREEEEELHRQEEEERREREAAMARKQAEAERKKELQRKREENIRRREEEQRRKDEEVKLRLEGQKRQREEEEQKRRQQEVERVRNEKRKVGRTHQIAVKFGDETDSAVQQRQHARDQVIATQQLVEEERRKAEEKLQRRMERIKAKQANEKQQQGSDGVNQTDGRTQPDLKSSSTSSAGAEGGKSFGGYTNLVGDIVSVTVTKVCKKLGIAIDGGANTKQKAVIIREISPEGCAAKTAVPGLKVGQQLLQVDSTSLHGLRHKDTVMAIKSAFEGPMNKTITFIVLDNMEASDGDQTDGPPEQDPLPDPIPEPVPEPTPEPAPEPQPQVQLRKKKRPVAMEGHSRDKGLDDFIALASSDLPSRRQGAVRQDTGKSFGGYSNLHGEILTIPVTKVNKKLGMAIDGGANTKQQAVTIRQITPDGSAALSGVGLKVGQQILQVNSRSLHGLSHGDAVTTIKTSFEGPINTTTITFIVLDPQS